MHSNTQSQGVFTFFSIQCLLLFYKAVLALGAGDAERWKKK